MIFKYFCIAPGLLFLSASRCLAQAPATAPEPASDSWKERGMSFGLNYSRNLFVDVAHYRSYVYRMGALPLYSTSLSYGSEFSYLNGLVVAPKIQACLHLLFLDLSLAPVLYTDFSSTSLQLRPEIGLGGSNFDLNYGYNAALTNPAFTKLNRHLLALRYYWPVRRRSRHTYNSSGQLIH
jgi:hypothetical protein